MCMQQSRKNIIMRVGAPLVGALYNNEKNNKKIDRINVIMNVNNRAGLEPAPAGIPAPGTGS